MHSQYLWNVANRGQIRLTCMQVTPLLIIWIPLLENIMCGKTEGSASPNAHSVFRVWRPLLKGPWHSWNPSSAQEPRRLSQVPSSALVPRLRKAQGSQQHQGFSVPTWTVLCRAWLPAATLQRNLLQKILALHKLVEVYTSLKEPIDIKRVEAPALPRRQQQASTQADSLSSI